MDYVSGTTTAILKNEALSAGPNPGHGEAALRQAALEGNGRAFSDLVRAHLPMMYRVAMRGCSNASLAEDAVQESLTVAFNKFMPKAGDVAEVFSGKHRRQAYVHAGSFGETTARSRGFKQPASVMASPLENVEYADLSKKIRSLRDNAEETTNGRDASPRWRIR